MNIQIFFAGSFELVEDRNAFEIRIARTNKKWASRDVNLSLFHCGDFLEAVSETRSQDGYNVVLKQADIFVLIFYSKVGKFTEEEFEQAFGAFKDNKKPFIFVYQKISDPSLILQKSATDFISKLNSLEYFQIPYKTVEGLLLHFDDQLFRLYDDDFKTMKTTRLNLYNFSDYFILQERLVEITELYDLIPADDVNRRIELAQKIDKIETDKKILEREILKVAETLKNISIDTPRLNTAKKLFETGNLKQADEILSTEYLSRNQELLLKQKESIKTQKDDLKKKLFDNANEYLIKAQIIATRFNENQFFENACSFFEKSLESYSYIGNNSVYGIFLLTHRKFSLAKKYFHYVEKRKAQLLPNEICLLFLNLGDVYEGMKDYARALQFYKKSFETQKKYKDPNEKDQEIQIYSLATRILDTSVKLGISTTYVDDQLKALTNLEANHKHNINLQKLMTYLSIAIFYSRQRDFVQSEKYFNKAFNVYQEIAKPDFTALVNYGNALSDYGNMLNRKGEYTRAEKILKNAIELKEKLLEKYPHIIYQNYTNCLNTLGVVLIYLSKFHDGETYIKKALDLRKKLSEAEPEIYMIEVAQSISNLGFLHYKQHDFTVAIEFHKNSLEILNSLTRNDVRITVDKIDKLISIGACFNNLGNFSEAIVNLLQAHNILDNATREFVEHHAFTFVRVKINLAESYISLNERGSACGYVRSARKIIDSNSPKSQLWPHVNRQLNTLEQVCD